MWPKPRDSMKLDPKAVADIMKARNIRTAYELSKLIGRDKNEVKAWIEADRGITRPNAKLIADAMKCEIENLTGKEPFNPVPDPRAASSIAAGNSEQVIPNFKIFRLLCEERDWTEVQLAANSGLETKTALRLLEGNPVSRQTVLIAGRALGYDENKMGDLIIIDSPNSTAPPLSKTPKRTFLAKILSAISSVLGVFGYRLEVETAESIENGIRFVLRVTPLALLPFALGFGLSGNLFVAGLLMLSAIFLGIICLLGMTSKTAFTSILTVATIGTAATITVKTIRDNRKASPPSSPPTTKPAPPPTTKRDNGNNGEEPQPSKSKDRIAIE